MKNAISTIICYLWLVNSSFSQSYNRMENPNYARTTFFEDFNSSLNPKIWNATIHEIKSGSPNYAPNLYAFIDSNATLKINQSTGSLELSMLNYPNYPATDWNGHIIRVNFIAGEVQTIKRFSYGVFECDATFSDGHGSFPSFWIYDNTGCQPRGRNEIDIVELKINNSNSNFDYNTFLYPASCGQPQGNEYHTFPALLGSHTFKCTWSPSQIEFLEDNTKVGTIVHTSQNWYPQYPMQIKLSQQV